MFKIQVKDRAVEQRTVKNFTFRTQTGWTVLNGETRRVPLSLTDDQKPYEEGVYAIGDASFYFGDYGKLMLGRLELVPIAAAGVQSQRQTA